MMNYYDLVLGTIPLSLLGGTGVMGLLGVDLWTAVPLAALGALMIILHALFVRSPVAEPVERTTSARPPSSQPAD